MRACSLLPTGIASALHITLTSISTHGWRPIFTAPVSELRAVTINIQAEWWPSFEGAECL